jgi:hypothetical protein
MSEATIEKARVPTEALGPRFRLSGLLLLVLAAGLSLGVISRAHLPNGTAGSVGDTPVTRWLGVAMAPIGVALCLTLAIQAFGCINCRHLLKQRAWPVCWRIAALAALAMLLAEESSLLTMTASNCSSGNWPPGLISRTTVDTRLRLLPPVLGLMMAGLVLGMRPRRDRSAVGRKGLPTWSVVLAGLCGTVIAATMMYVPYLVLIAIEAVQVALMRPGEGSAGLLINPPPPPMAPGLADRLDGTIPEVGLALMVVLITGGWLASSLRRAGGDDADRGSRRVLLFGLALAAACLISGHCLIFRALPSVQKLALDGLGMLLGVGEFGAVVIGSSLFSAGLVAHMLTPGIAPADGRGNWLFSGWNRHAVWLARAVMIVFLLVVILSNLEHIKRYGSIGRFIPDWLFRLLDLVPAPVWTARDWLQGNPWIDMLSGDASFWFPLLVIPWLAWRSIGLLLRAGNPTFAPCDHIFDSISFTCRFFGYSFALLALLLAAVPTLALAGLVVLHHALGAAR